MLCAVNLQVILHKCEVQSWKEFNKKETYYKSGCSEFSYNILKMDHLTFAIPPVLTG